MSDYMNLLPTNASLEDVIARLNEVIEDQFKAEHPNYCYNCQRDFNSSRALWQHVEKSHR